LGANHPDTGSSLNNLAELYRAQDKYTEAEPLFQRVLTICEQQWRPDHPTTRTVRQNYASFLQAFTPRNEKQ
jgi:hypothetical protein